jgi:hypothetical protein
MQYTSGGGRCLTAHAADGPNRARSSARAAPSDGAAKGSVGLCGRRHEGPQLMRKASLGGRIKDRGILQMRRAR